MLERHRLYWALLLVVLLGGFASGVPASEADYRAWIDVETSDGAVTVLALGRAGAEGRRLLAFEMTVRREGASGVSNSRQSGDFESRAGRVDTLARVDLNTGPGDRLRAVLVVREGERIAALDTLVRRW